MNQSSVLAWDGPTRAFKWALVLVVLNGWISNTYGASVPAWHVWNGYAALVLIVFRLLWGLAGSSTARFAGFVAGPGLALTYLRTGVKYLGHNPLGGWMVLVLLALTGAMATTGLFAADEDRLIIEGPLVRTVSDAVVGFAARWHHRIFDALLICISLHVAAVAFYTLVKRDRLVPAMFTGRKPAALYADAAAAVPVGWGRALLCLAVATVLVFGTIYAAGGRPF